MAEEAEPIYMRPGFIPDAPDFEDVITRVATEDDRTSHFIHHYDLAVMEWVRAVVNIDGSGIRAIKSTPMRAFADYRCLLEEQDPNVAAKLADATSLARFPLPLAVIGRASREWRSNWGNSQVPMRRTGLSDGNLKTGYIKAPRPINLTYQIDFYAKMELHMRWIIERIEEAFHPMAYALIDTPYKTDSDADGLRRYMPIKYGGVVDNSDLEPDDGSDKLLRETLSITVEGFKWYDIKEAPVAHRITMDTIEGEDDTPESVLESIIIDETDDVPELTLEETQALPTNPDTDGVS